MQGYGSSSYGDGFADVYDRWYHDLGDTEACVARLAELAGPDGAVLELGVGTGRLAVPLAGLGLTVTGVDASEPMLERLAAKPGGDAVRAVHGDMADLSSADPPVAPAPAFSLVVVAYNTLFNLPTAASQRAAIDGAAARLLPGARLVVEAFVPDDDPSARRDDVAVSRIDATELVLSATVHDPAAQTITGQHVQITDAGVRIRPWLVRYLHPAQLDELAASAGLALEQRWSDWSGSPFGNTSATHVSVYRRPA